MGKFILVAFSVVAITVITKANAENVYQHPDLRVAYVWLCAVYGFIAGMLAGAAF